MMCESAHHVKRVRVRVRVHVCVCVRVCMRVRAINTLTLHSQQLSHVYM